MPESLDELTEARDQMEELVRVIVEIGSVLDLDVTLHRIVDGALTLTGARYGALGIRATDGTLVSFVPVGLDEATARRLGGLPVGEGVRIDNVTSTGLEADNAPLRALLAIPITVRAADFGTLYLADDRPGRVFTDSHEDAVRTLATAAAAAIDNARLYEREREAARWTKASREITTALLSGDPQTGPLQLIVNRALELADAEQAILLVPRELNAPADDVDSLVVAATAGRYASQVIGQQVPMDGSTTGGVARRGLPLITASFQYPIVGFTDVGERSAIVMPLIADDAVLGVIAVARHPQQPPFGNDYLELVSDFARHASIALALAAGREHALNQELAQADTVDAAVHAAAEELRRLWRARRVLAVTFPSQGSSTEAASATPQTVAVGGEPAQWTDLPAHTRRMLISLRESDLLTSYTPEPGAAGISLQHPAGVLVVWIELTEQRTFTLEDQTLLTVLAGRLSQGLQRVHQVDQQRETALALQHAILGPAHLPRGFAVRYAAASPPLQVGGDWYDIVDLEDGRIGLIVGDCVGHGLAAATVMGQVRSACRALLFENPSPAAVLAALDRFAARLPGARSTTAVCAVLNPDTGELVYSSAGHPPAILAQPDGATRLLDDGHTIALGIRPNRSRPEGHVTIPARAALVLYTDGLVERRRSSIDEGISRVVGVVQHGRASTLDDVADEIMSGLAPSGGYQDDVVLLLHLHPGPLELTFPPDVGQLAPVRSALRHWLGQAGVGPQQTLDILVAAGEAVANGIEHGHREQLEGTISLNATALVDEVQLTITDTGTWKTPEPVNVSYRGRGMPMMRTLMHDVTVNTDTAGTTVGLCARITR